MTTSASSETTATAAIFLNETEINSFNHLRQVDYIIPISINLFLILLTLWSLVALTYYGNKAGKWKNLQSRRHDQLGVGMVYSSVIVCTVACLSYLFATLVYMNVGYGEKENELCNIIGDISNFTYGFVLMSVYMFLWTRQRVFYKTQTLNVKYGKGVQFFSSASIVVIFAAGISVLVFLMLPYNHISSYDGCLYLPDNDLRIGYWISVFIVGAFGQTILLGLLIYALKQSRGDKWQNDSHCVCSEIFVDMFSSFSGSSASDETIEDNKQRFSTYSMHNLNGTNSRSTKMQQQQSKIIRWILYKTLIFAILSTSCDLVFQIYVHYGASSSNNRRIDAAIGSVCAYLNLLFRILSFAKYKEMLFPFFRKI